jgi:carotenoid cleavage dioxygenase
MKLAHGQARAGIRRVAVVGAGAAGMFAARLLSEAYDVALVEAEDRIGGHAHAVVVPDGPDAGTALDAGFINCAHSAYPRLFGYFDALGVPTARGDSSFCYFNTATDEHYYFSVGPQGKAGTQAPDPRLFKYLNVLARFYRRAAQDLAAGELRGLTLGDYCARTGLAAEVIERFVIPVYATLWVAPPDRALEMSAEAVYTFYRRVGLPDFGGYDAHFVKGGSQVYIDALMRDYAGRIRLSQPVHAVQRDPAGVELIYAGGARERFDAVVMAIHADRALALLAEPTPQERALLGAWTYYPCQVVVHRDSSVIPAAQAYTAAWNYATQGDAATQKALTVSYYLNQVMQLDAQRDYYVTINPTRPIDPAYVLREMTWQHGFFSVGAHATQAWLPSLQGNQATYFCGSYFSCGSHEDAVTSAEAVLPASWPRTRGDIMNTATTAVDYRNPFAVGAFRPVTEELTAVDLPIEGALPRALDGLFVRNGFAPLPGAPLPPHLFFADGLLHGVRLEAGRVKWFRNRWVVTEGVAAHRGAAPPKGPADIRWAPVNPANTHFIHHGNRFLALCETGLPYELTAELETIGRYDFAGRLKTSMTAHPRIAPATGEMHFFAYGPRPPFVQYYRARADGELVQTAAIDVGGPAVMHDFIITERHAVFFDTPLQFAPPSGGGGLPFAWKEGYPARIGLYAWDEPGARTRWFEIAPCYVSHFLNAFEDKGTVVVRGVARDIGYALATNPPNQGAMSMREWRIDLATGTVTAADVSDRRGDFPRVDERYMGRPHRFGYGMEVPDTEDWAVRGCLFKYDFATGAVAVHDFGKGRKASEPVFVPARPDAAEDDGWVLSYVHDETGDGAFLAVLNAQDFAGAPAAIIPLPQRVPYGAHGSWIDAAAL